MGTMTEDVRAAYANLMRNYGAEGLRLTLERTVSFSDPDVHYGVRIERERTLPSGRQGKPTLIVLLINNPDETPAGMLRQLADLFESPLAAIAAESVAVESGA